MNPSSSTSDVDAILEKISADKRADFLRWRQRLGRFADNDEILTIAGYLDAFLAVTAEAAGPSKLNGNQPADLKLAQLSDLNKRTDALALCVKSLPRREDVVSRQDIEKLLDAAGLANPDLMAFLDEWRITKSQESSTKRAVTRLLGRIAAIAALTFIVFGVGYLVCWINLHKNFDARIDSVIEAHQSAYRVPLFLAAHQGSIALGPLTPAEGHNESQGIIIRPGDLKLAQPWVSTDGATVVPLR
jgi:hypothetical protein